MDRDSVTDRGAEIASAIRELARSFHTRDDRHDILAWLAGWVEARVDALVHTRGVDHHFAERAVAGERVLAELDPRLLAQVRGFETDFERAVEAHNRRAEQLSRTFSDTRWTTHPSGLILPAASDPSDDSSD